MWCLCFAGRADLISGSYVLATKVVWATDLVKLVVPLSGIHAPVDDFVDTLSACRAGPISLVHWPDCAPQANDRRMAREFLLFLEYYGYCKRVIGADDATEKFVLESVNISAIHDIIAMQLPNDMSQAAQAVGKSGIADFVERQRILRLVLDRPDQSKFRKAVLKVSEGRCVITGTQLAVVLEAAHIVPVQAKGSDQVGNGLCLRSDVHTLYDNGHLRVSPSGSLHISASSHNDPTYALLPHAIKLPAYVNASNIEWRWKYM